MLAACGASSQVVVHVGAASITRQAVGHWMAVLAQTGEVPKPPRYGSCVSHLSKGGPKRDRAALELTCEHDYRALLSGALAQLISWQWLIQEATSRSLSPSRRAVEERVAQERESAKEQLRALDKAPVTTSDLELEASAELAEAMIERTLTASLPAVSGAEIASYYREHLADFLVAQRRYFLIRSLKSQAAALALRAEVESGASFAKKALRETRTSSEAVEPGREAIDRAIFVAKPNVLTGPILLSDIGDHSLFEVTSIVPARYLPLAQVRSEIAQRIAVARQNAALDRFARAWTAKWSSRTQCASGYVVQQCREYTGQHTAVNPFAGG